MSEKNNLFIKRGKNYLFLFLFLTVIVSSSIILYGLGKFHSSFDYFLAFTFHLLQYLFVIIVFEDELKIIQRGGNGFFYVLLLLGLIFFSSYFFKTDSTSIRYYFNAVTFNLTTLLPVTHLLFSKFIFAEQVFDEAKYKSRKNVIEKLKQAKAITDIEYANKTRELSYLKTKSNILLTQNYIDMKKDVKNGVLTNEELDSYLKNEIMKALGNE